MKKTLFLFLLVLLPSLTFGAGIIKNTEHSYTYLRPHSIQVDVEINNQVSITTVKETYKNKGAVPLFMKYGFPLDINASATEFIWTMNGVALKAVLTGQAPDTTAANPGGSVDYILKEYLGESPFYFSFSDSLPPDSSIIIQLTYIELLKYSAGEIYYTFPLDAKGLEQTTLNKFTVNVNINSERTLENIEAVSHSGIQTNISAHNATASYNTSNLNPDKDFTIKYTVSQKDLGVFLLSTKPQDEDGFFIMLAEPDPKTGQSEILSKNFIFVMDLSGSMSGIKVQQAREAAVYCLTHLNTRDKFNIITFRDVITKYKSGLIDASPGEIQDAINFVNQQYAIKGATTNINDALLSALSQFNDPNAANIIIFLTDGRASVGEQNSDAILHNIGTANTTHTQIYVFGIGSDVERYLLTSLSEQNNGITEYLENEEVNEKISEFFYKIRDPLIQDINITFSPNVVNETYPMNLMDIYVGEQLVLLGRYTTPGDVLLSLSGRRYDEPLDYTYNVNFTAAADTNYFIPKMWAKEKINALLILIDLVGEDSNPGREYIKEIIRLSLKYGITTKYTSFEEPATGIDNEDGLTEDEQGQKTPQGFILHQNYPNPFNPVTTISFSLPENGYVLIKIYDITGRLVKVLIANQLSGGVHQFAWDGSDSNGQPVAAGIYIYQVEFTNMKGETFIRTKKMSLVK
ncbi:VWA domain-containing protein [candidate division KSB1 bacterium]|nr:VWA domain-containing protein [candidate division KSB1 bacterium]